MVEHGAGGSSPSFSVPQLTEVSTLRADFDTKREENDVHKRGVATRGRAYSDRSSAVFSSLRLQYM
jgi:hypothetical protein